MPFTSEVRTHEFSVGYRHTLFFTTTTIKCFDLRTLVETFALLRLIAVFLFSVQLIAVIIVEPAVQRCSRESEAFGSSF